MRFEFLDMAPRTPLVEDTYVLEITKEDLPYESLIVQRGISHMFRFFSKAPHRVLRGKELTELRGIQIQGPNYGAFKVEILEPSFTIGVCLHPTTMFKLTGKDMSYVYNGFASLEEHCPKLFETVSPVFKESKNDPSLFSERFYTAIEQLDLKINQRTKDVDEAIRIIHENKGLINIKDITDKVAITSKTLNYQFKKIVGITIGRYIRQYRFISLITQYQQEEIDFYEMMYKYNYYDSSHFTKDFHFFTMQSPKEYFKKDYPLINKYLKA
ncbi:MAG: hypothetical protein CMB99_09365 [Flavobacteriaceae bacterium]|nr:hypothetical protein [Flavobacteriaceae bacterium]|tara:strand:- start:461807 stop:462616 length:810 start_codon:yes stop_codon:yes gene_type:complete